MGTRAEANEPTGGAGDDEPGAEGPGTDGAGTGANGPGVGAGSGANGAGAGAGGAEGEPSRSPRRVAGWLGSRRRPRREATTGATSSPQRSPAAPAPEPAPVAFVLASGANLGAVQVGMLRALVEHGITPDLVVGSSVGALNGAGFAQDPTPAGVARLEHVWCSTSGRDLMPRQWIPPAVAMARRGEAIHPIGGLQRLLHRAFTADTFEDLQVRFQCVATDVVEGRERWFSTGPLVPAVLASSALPAMFPSVEIDGRRYLDGAIVNDVPLRRAVELGARTLYVLEVGPLSRSWTEPKRPLDTAMGAYWIMRRHRFRSQIEALPPDVAVHLMPHGDPPSLRFHDFDHSPQLIRAAYLASTVYLDELQSRPAPAVAT